ncbi:MAG: 4Fe-4S dicluster domain-containing protein [Proteobacteria bacterium]|jgi:heterodisulfide reductase subunit C2|nr:4Fe-4S dicluster domain-containing protein [Pseudomonadota bacterium]
MPDLKETEKDMWQEVFDSVDLRHCFNCSTCITGCPASHADPPLLIRNLARMVILGLEDDLLDDDTPWSCVTCSRCEEMCPMDVKPFELCLAVRQWQSANDETRIPPSIIEIYHRGYTQAVEKNTDQRKALGLPEKLPVLGDDGESLAQFQEMLMKTEVISDNDYMFQGE